MTQVQRPRAPRRTPRWSLLLVAVATVVGLGGCGGSDDSGPIMSVALTLSPNPITAAPSAEAVYDWVAVCNVRLVESGGLGGAISEVVVNLYEVVDGVDTLVGAAETRINISSTRLDANGTNEFVLATDYLLPDGGRAVNYDVFVRLVDDDGFSLQIGDRVAVE